MLRETMLKVYLHWEWKLSQIYPYWLLRSILVIVTLKQCTNERDCSTPVFEKGLHLFPSPALSRCDKTRVVSWLVATDVILTVSITYEYFSRSRMWLFITKQAPDQSHDLHLHTPWFLVVVRVRSSNLRDTREAIQNSINCETWGSQLKTSLVEDLTIDTSNH